MKQIRIAIAGSLTFAAQQSVVAQDLVAQVLFGLVVFAVLLVIGQSPDDL